MSTHLNAESAIASIVEAMLPRGGSVEGMEESWRAGELPTRALYISVSLQASYYDEGGDESHGSKMVHFIFCRPTNYTKVFVAIDGSWHIPKPEAFKMKSDHDSGWRTDGMRDLFETWLSVRNDGEMKDAPRAKISDFNTIKDIKWVQITWEDDPEDQHRYRKLLTSIKGV